MAEEAQRLGAARMGTVNAVLGGLANDRCLELGLYPGLVVLDDAQANAHLSRSLDEALTTPLQKELAALEYRLGVFDWQSAIKRILESARSNGLGPEDLEDCKARSIKDCMALLGEPEGQPDSLERNLKEALAGFLDQVDLDDDNTGKTGTAVEISRGFLDRFNRGMPLAWKDWFKLGNLSAARASDHLCAPVREAAGVHDSHPGLRRDMQRAIELVFFLAKEALNEYQEYKRQRGAMDFADQEALALQLLNEEHVLGELSEELDLLVVDEFQDTSPIELAAFLKLAEACGRAIWVGDQKQSIYAFRGTDPALMDSCLEVLSRKSQMVVLGKSWRSRPPLVKVTSGVFAKAFAGHGLDPKHVILKPAQKEDPPELGPCLERWVLHSGDRRQSKGTQASALASGIAELLADKTNMVRDKGSGKPRPLLPGDIGILCRTNEICRMVADRLAGHGIKAMVRRPGLMTRPEILLVMAGLRLWVDGKDNLAAAELARIVHYPERPDEWFRKLVECKGGECFLDLPEASAILDLSGSHPTAGPITAFDMVLDACGIREVCLAWGDFDDRLTNLEAMRGHCHQYAAAALAEGSSATVTGFINYLWELEQAGDDSQGVASGTNAVDVTTWHGAKGLEWPVTVLHQPGKVFPTATHGVVVMGRRDGFDANDPLAGRWVRYWPYPYHSNTINVPFHRRAISSSDFGLRQLLDQRQNMRLLYVGWTRARDRLVIATPPGHLHKGLLELLEQDGKQLLSEPVDGAVNWGGHGGHLRSARVAAC